MADISLFSFQFQHFANLFALPQQLRLPLHSVIAVVKHVAFNFPSTSYDELERVLVRIYSIYIVLHYGAGIPRPANSLSPYVPHIMLT